MFLKFGLVFLTVAIQTSCSQFSANFDVPQGLGFNFNSDTDNSNNNNNFFAGIPNLFGRALSSGFNLNLNRKGQPRTPSSGFRFNMNLPSGSSKTGNSNSFRIGFGNEVENYASSNSSFIDTTEKPSDERISLSSMGSELPGLLTPRRNLISTTALRGPAFESGYMSSQLGPLETASVGRKINFGSDTNLSFDSRLRQQGLTAASNAQRLSAGGSNSLNLSKGVSRILVNTDVEPAEHGVVEYSRQTIVITQKPSIITVHHSQQKLPKKPEKESDKKFRFKPVTAVLKKRLHKIQIPVYNGYDDGASCDAKSPFLLLHTEDLGDGRTRYFHCIDGSMKGVVCPSDKPALQDICNGYDKHCWRYLAFDASIDPKQIADNAYQYYRCLGKI
ncbi:uncharacterized protein LOC100900000 [Galendromus occidentalis]|uniref:Uncharacterized protein LOC100900000 n=1 Tax=Galendromus occidentalis TaxID=34638 RepID=A0AAJ7L5Z8_9ACAR|nr:uncharacterized protein LOC100900000 [Galendromus occidentalis]